MPKVKWTRTIVVEGPKDWVDENIKNAFLNEDSQVKNFAPDKKMLLIAVNYEEYDE